MLEWNLLPSMAKKKKNAKWFIKLICFDELQFCLSSDAPEHWIRKSDERIMPTYIKRIEEHGNGGIMVW